MENYGIRYDFDGRYYVVVKWDNPEKPITGSVVYKCKNEPAAQEWIIRQAQGTLENTGFDKKRHP